MRLLNAMKARLGCKPARTATDKQSVQARRGPDSHEISRSASAVPAELVLQTFPSCSTRLFIGLNSLTLRAVLPEVVPVASSAGHGSVAEALKCSNKY